MMNNQQLEWAMLRIAQMQGSAADVLALRAGLASLDNALAPMLQLQKIASHMGLEAPLVLEEPDRAHLPLICHADELGWAVLIDRDPADQWVLVHAEGQHTLAHDALKGVVALVKFNPHEDAHKLSQAMGSKPVMKTC